MTVVQSTEANACMIGKMEHSKATISTKKYWRPVLDINLRVTPFPKASFPGHKRNVKCWDNLVPKDFPKTYIVRLNKCAMQLSNYCPVTTTCMSPSFQLPRPSVLVTTFQY